MVKRSYNILIAIADGPLRDSVLPQEQINYLRQMGTVKIAKSGENISRKWLIDNVSDADILLTLWGTPTIDDEVLAHCRKLKLIVHCGGSVADLCCKSVFDRGIIVASANVPIAKGVVEYCLCMTILGLRKFHIYNNRLKQRKNWWPDTVEKMESDRPIKGAVIGIIGWGDVSRRLIPELNSLGANVLVYSNDVPKKECGFSIVDLDTILTNSDCIILLCSITRKTKHIINQRNLSKIKSGAVLINPGRGKLIDQAALITELKKGRFSCVLDVFETEPLEADSELRELNNAFITPHIAGLSHGRFIGSYVIEQIEQFISGRIPSGKIEWSRAQTMSHNNI